MSTEPRLSVVIPTYQRRASVARALAAIAQQTVPPAEYEVIVSIDGSDDGTRELTEAVATPYALHSLWQPNQGRAAAVNAGIRAARGEVLVLLDDDMEPAPGWLAGHWAAHTAQARAGVMGAAPIRWGADALPVVSQYVGPKFNAHMQHLAQPDQALSLRDFYSGNFSIRRRVLLEVGLFDEAFKVYGNEDLELSLRLVKAGVTLSFAAEALAYQHYTKDFRGLARDTVAKGQTAVLLASKHPEAFASLQLSHYRQGARAWRWLRAGLLGVSRFQRSAPGPVVAITQFLERRRPRALPLIYRLALDYCYWLGVETALRANRRRRQGLLTLTGANPTWA